MISRFLKKRPVGLPKPGTWKRSRTHRKGSESERTSLYSNSPVQMLLSSSHQSILPRTLEKCYFFSFLTLMLFLHNKTESVFFNRPFPREASNYPSIFGFRQIVITHKIPAVDTTSICIHVLHFLNDAETSINSTLFQEN